MSLDADLEQLWIAGYVHIPRIAETYSTIGQRVSESIQGMDSAFKTPGQDTSNMQRTEWSSLRTSIQYIVDQTCVNLLDTSDALLRVVDAYRESDLITAEELDKIDTIINNYPTSENDANYDPGAPVDLPPESPIPRPDDPRGIDIIPHTGDTYEEG